jgi:hypothetical protein
VKSRQRTRRSPSRPARAKAAITRRPSETREFIASVVSTGNTDVWTAELPTPSEGISERLRHSALIDRIVSELQPIFDRQIRASVQVKPRPSSHATANGRDHSESAMATTSASKTRAKTTSPTRARSKSRPAPVQATVAPRWIETEPGILRLLDEPAPLAPWGALGVYLPRLTASR